MTIILGNFLINELRILKIITTRPKCRSRLGTSNGFYRAVVLQSKEYHSRLDLKIYPKRVMGHLNFHKTVPMD